MTPARRVLNAIEDALVLADRNPVAFARLSRRGGNCHEASMVLTLWMAGIPTAYAYQDRLTNRDVSNRRRHGKRQRAARRKQRGQA